MNYKNLTDIELWQYCCEDDRRAYNELFERYYLRVFHLVCRYVKDKMTAEELCMDQLFKLWAKRKQTKIEGEFSNYLFRCTRNLVISHLRKNITLTIGLDELKEESRTDNSADSGLMSEEITQAYHKALKKLPPRRREVFILSREKNLSYPEIARKMNLSVNTVENYMVAALDNMRQNMKEYFPTFLLPLLILSSFLFSLL